MYSPECNFVLKLDPAVEAEVEEEEDDIAVLPSLVILLC